MGISIVTNTVMLNLFQHPHSISANYIAGSFKWILKQVQDDLILLNKLGQK